MPHHPFPAGYAITPCRSILRRRRQLGSNIVEYADDDSLKSA